MLNSNYLSVPVRDLIGHHQTPCDLYISLSDDKFVKILNANEVFDEDFILKYLYKSVTSFYLKSFDKDKWDEFFLEKVKLEIKQESYSDSDPAKELTNTFRRVRKYSLEIGISKDVVELIEGLQQKTIKSLRKNKSLYKDLLRMATDENYLADHSLMVSSVACAVAIKMSWSTQATLKKFIIAGLFHDISLDNSDLAKIHFSSEIEINNFSKEELQKIMDHPQQGADEFLKSNLSCPNADKIIFCHHELPDGSGFPRGLDSFNLPQYVCLFIIAEEVVRVLSHYDSSKDAWNYLEKKISSEYSSGNFRKPSQGFLSFFEQNFKKS